MKCLKVGKPMNSLSAPPLGEGPRPQPRRSGSAKQRGTHQVGLRVPQQAAAACPVSTSGEDWTPSDSEVVPVAPLSERPREPTGGLAGVRALVAGATGGTGRAIVERLVAEGVPVRALVRDVAAAVRAPYGLRSCSVGADCQRMLGHLRPDCVAFIFPIVCLCYMVTCQGSFITAIIACR